MTTLAMVLWMAMYHALMRMQHWWRRQETDSEATSLGDAHGMTTHIMDAMMSGAVKCLLAACLMKRRRDR